MNKLLTTLFLGLFAISVNAQNFKISNIPEGLTDNADAVVRLDETTVTVTDQRNYTINQTRVVTVLNKKGENYINAVEHYSPGTKIKQIGAVILDAFGNEIEKVKEKDFIDRSVVEGFFGDNRVKYLDYVATSYPYTVVYTSEVTTSNTAFIPSWYAFSSYYEGVEKSIYTIHVPKELGLRHKEKNFGTFAIESQELPDGYKYTATNIKAAKPEVYDLPGDFFFPKVMFALNKFHLEGVDGEATDWASFGKWMYDNLLAKTFDLSEETKNKMRKLVADKPTTYEKAKAIYEYVQQNTRYISIQVGIGGWQPMQASAVDKFGYGDCKALTNYTKNLLDAVGITAYYTVVASGSDYSKSLEEDFASIQGNHIILEIPTENKNVWVDCTSQIHPFDFVGDFTDNRSVLIIKPEGGEIVKTVAYKNAENLKVTHSNCSLDANGNLTGSVSIETHGIQYDNHFYMEMRTKDEQDKHYKSYWSNVNNLSLNNIQFQNDKKQVVFTEKVDVNAANYLHFSGNTGLLVINAFNNGVGTPDRYKDRTSPLYISRGFLDKDTYEIKLPENFKIEALPDPVEENHEFGTYKMNVEQRGDTLIYNREFSFIAGTYPKEKYEEFRQFLRMVSKSDNAKIVINK